MNEMIDKYHVVRLIGRGGMAEVFEVINDGPVGFKKKLCLKKMNSEKNNCL